MRSLLWLFNTAIWLYIYVLLASVILSWLVSFGIVNAQQPLVRQIGDVLWRLTEPALQPVRRIMGRYLPNLGGIDLSPMVLAILLIFLSMFVSEMALTLQLV